MNLSEFLKRSLESEKISTLEDTTSSNFKREKERQELESMKQDMILRKTFAKSIFWVVVSYIGVVFVVLFLYGFSFLKISDAVLITLLGTTTANILSLLVIVFNYLFPKK